MKKLILILLSIFIISCSSYDKDEYNNDQSLYEDNKFEDYELFNMANNYIGSGQLDLALIELDRIEVLFPSSSYAKKSILLTAYIHFLKKDYEKTRALAEAFKNYYPGSQDIIYASYLEAMTYFVIMKKSDYTQDNSKIALDKFNFILNAYPNNKYEVDILTRLYVINDNLAENKLKIAKYYLEEKNYNGSLLYLKDIFNNQSTSISIEETLYLLSKIYITIDEYELAKKYASILAYNFPTSDWYKKSYNLLNDLDNIQNDKKWYEKYNPIKIFKRNLENNSNKTIIQPI